MLTVCSLVRLDFRLTVYSLLFRNQRGKIFRFASSRKRLYL